MVILDLSFDKVSPPLCGGHLRIREFNKALSCRENVTVKQYSFDPRFFNIKREYNINGEHYTERILSSLLYSTAISITWLLFRIRCWLFVIPLIFSYIRPPRCLLQALGEADIILLEGPWLFSWIKKYTDRPLVVTAHNVEYFMTRSILKDRKTNRWIHEFVSKSVFRTEKQALRGADAILAVTGDDKETIAGCYSIEKNKIIITLNGINSSSFKTIVAKDKIKMRAQLGLQKFKRILLFTGSFHPPNRTGADYIINQLAPDFPEDILFLIAGSVCPRSWRRGNVYCTGPVNRSLMENFFAVADISLNTVVYGSGSNIKNFEYLASGLPVISTRVGARGLSPEIEAPVVTVSDQEKFPEAVRKLLSMDTAKLKAGALKASEYHDYNKIAGDVIRYFRDLISRKKSGKTPLLP